MGREEAVRYLTEADVLRRAAEQVDALVEDARRLLDRAEILATRLEPEQAARLWPSFGAVLSDLRDSTEVPLVASTTRVIQTLTRMGIKTTDPASATRTRAELDRIERELPEQIANLPSMDERLARARRRLDAPDLSVDELLRMALDLGFEPMTRSLAPAESLTLALAASRRATERESADIRTALADGTLPPSLVAERIRSRNLVYQTHLLLLERAMALSEQDRLALVAEAFEIGQRALTTGTSLELRGARMPAERDDIAETMDIAAVRSRLTADEAVLFFLTRPDWQPTFLSDASTEFQAFAEEADHRLGPDSSRGWLVVLRRDGQNLVPLPAFDFSIGKDAQSLRSSMQVDGPTRGVLIARGTGKTLYDTAAAHRLYRALVQPAEPFLEGVHHIYVAGGEAFAGVPPHLFLTAPADAVYKSEQFADLPWLSDRYSIGLLPTLDRLQARGEGTATLGFGGSPNLLGVGDAIVPMALRNAPVVASSVRNEISQVSRTEFLSLAALPETRHELEGLGRAFENGVRRGEEASPHPSHTLLLGADATEMRLRQLSEGGQLADYGIIAFATHGLLAGGLTGLADASLVLTPEDWADPARDGLLTANEVAMLRLNARLVILSACDTARPRDASQPESLSGLARAFMLAGARSLLVSEWPVDSEATVELTGRTMALLIAEPKIGVAEALRRTMMMFADGAVRPEWRAPYYWAPFVFVGGR